MKKYQREMCGFYLLLGLSVCGTFSVAAYVESVAGGGTLRLLQLWAGLFAITTLLALSHILVDVGD